MTAASILAKSRTAWAALITVLVAIIGPRLGLTADEVATLIGALQGLVAVLRVTDERAGKRGKAVKAGAAALLVLLVAGCGTLAGAVVERLDWSCPAKWQLSHYDDRTELVCEPTGKRVVLRSDAPGVAP